MAIYNIDHWPEKLEVGDEVHLLVSGCPRRLQVTEGVQVSASRIRPSFDCYYLTGNYRGEVYASLGIDLEDRDSNTLMFQAFGIDAVAESRTAHRTLATYHRLPRLLLSIAKLRRVLCL